MSRGLEYIRDISCLILENYSDKEPLTEEQKLSKNCFLDYCKYIAKELDRLEQIDNANPSEALECLEKLELLTCDFEWYKDNINTIKQALIKSQEQEKVLKIIKKKNVMIYALKVSKTVDDYNDLVSTDEQLTQEEFDLIKEVLSYE